MYNPSFITRHSSFVNRHSSFVTRHLAFAIRHALFTLALLLMTLPVAAQKKGKPEEKEAHGVATYVAQGNESISDAKKKALQAAQLDAIQKAFGTSLIAEKDQRTIISGQNTSSTYRENTNAQLRGEWLEDTQAPHYEILNDDPLTYRVEVWGKVREILEAKVDITYRIYNSQNQETLEFQQTGIRETSHVYLDFTSPVAGNLVVYLLDETEGKAHLMLPYKNDTRPAYPIQKGETVTFFKSPFQGKSTRMRLTTNREADSFQLYIIFSPNTIYSNFDQIGKGNKLNAMDIDKFYEWLNRAKSTDKSMIVNSENITLENKTFK